MVYLDLHFLYLEENQVLMSNRRAENRNRGQLVSSPKCESVNVFYIVPPKNENLTTLSGQYKRVTTTIMCLWFWE